MGRAELPPGAVRVLYAHIFTSALSYPYTPQSCIKTHILLGHRDFSSPLGAKLLQHVPSAVPARPGIAAGYKRTSLTLYEYSWFMNIHWISIFMTGLPDSQLASLERGYCILIKYQTITKQLYSLGFNWYERDRYRATNVKSDAPSAHI